jgi:pyruvate dehydrogenase E1 component beta subunit
MPWSNLQILQQEDLGSKLTKGRILKYTEAVRESLDLALQNDKKIYLMGQGVDDPDGMFGCTKDLHRKFGRERVFDTPLSEDVLMGVATGSAVNGLRPIYMHNRPDFILLAMDQLINHAAKWSYMFGGQHKVPMVVWGAIGRGWGSGAQHSQSPQALFAHIPGLKVVMPSTPYDAKGLMFSAVADNNPVVILEHRWAMRHSGNVPEGIYFVPLGKGIIRKKGRDLTIVGVSHAILDAQQAAEELLAEKIDAEVIDLRTIKPIDQKIILTSIVKTGRLVIVDTGWKECGLSAEIAAIVAENGVKHLKSNIRRVTPPECPTPSGYTLENAFYINKEDIKKAARAVMK